MALLSDAQRRELTDEGYVVVEGVLDAERDFAPLFAEYSDRLGELANRLLGQGRLTSMYRDLPLTERLTQISAETGQTFGQFFDISLPQSGVQLETPIHIGPAVFRLLTHPRLLGLVEEVLGPEIYSNPVQHSRLKLPLWAFKPGSASGLEAAVSWHQDNGVILPEADESDILTVWLPITEATVNNGCLRVIPRSHLGGLHRHCTSDLGLRIPEQLLEVGRAVPLPMRPGSVLLMNHRTVHASLENRSNGVRWSFDLRYQVTGRPTGRPAFPGFVARSRNWPDTELRDPEIWGEMWISTREALAGAESPKYHRWTDRDELCA